jgi:hypothetical protein
MTTESFDQILEALLNRRPFRVFTVVLKNGTQFEIDHANATVMRNGLAIFLSPGGPPIWFDADSVLQITDAPSTATTTGRE